MGRYILRRLAISVPVLFLITVALFLLIELAPGDPISAMIDPDQAAVMGPDWVETQRRQLGLDQPLPVRYGIWLRETVQGNLGYSFLDRQPVSKKMGERLWPTITLMTAAQIIALVVAVPLGVLSAVRQYSKIDFSVTVLAFLAVSIPNFFLALGGIYLLGVKLGVVPTAGMGTMGSPAAMLDALHHLLLPASVLGLSLAAPLIRFIRSSMLEVLHQDYVQVARAKGLVERAVIVRHALRNSLIPVVTVVALNLPNLVGGTVIVEVIFAWPGMGTLVLNAVRALDFPVIMATNLVIAVAILLANLLADVLYAVLDPRIRYS
jgi:peptide/nickel transport system permease protein